MFTQELIMFMSNSTYPIQYYDSQFKDWFTPRGWVCPRCDRVNAPSVFQCPCSQHQFPLTATEPMRSFSAVLSRCPKCGEYVATLYVNGKAESGKCACERQSTG